MDDVIYRQAAIDALWGLRREQQMMDDTQRADLVMQGIRLAEKALSQLPKAQPTADVPERNVGKWIKVGDNSYRCSVCNEISCCNGNFCPDCGADMRERGEDG